MSRNEKKRKRDAVQDNASPILSKTQQDEVTTDSKTREDGRSSKKVKTGDSKQKKSERKSKRQIQEEKHRPQKDVQNSTVDSLASGQDFIALTDNDATDKKKKERKPSKKSLQNVKGVSPRMQRKRRQAAKAEAEAQAAGQASEEHTDGTTTQPRAKKEANQTEANSSSNSRFIVFVGNLPYDATTEQIQAHFAKLQPSSVRLRTDKKTGKSKGFAFLEFTNYDRMKTCLQLYHHSIFDPHAASTGESNRNDKSRRKINVELTAGGGGKSSDRKSKILEKNKKLSEERERTKVKQLEKKAELERKRILKAEKEAKEGKKTGANAQPVQVQDNRGDIHPSRLARVQG